MEEPEEGHDKQVDSVVAVPEERPDRPLTPEEIARIDSFVKRFQQGQRRMGSGVRVPARG